MPTLVWLCGATRRLQARDGFVIDQDVMLAFATVENCGNWDQASTRAELLCDSQCAANAGHAIIEGAGVTIEAAGLSGIAVFGYLVGASGSDRETARA